MTGAISSTPFIVFSVTVMWLSFDFYLPQSIEPEAPYFEGNPGQTLQAIVMALTASGDEYAVLHTLQRTRELYKSRMQANLTSD
jgi:hypothetical protein